MKMTDSTKGLIQAYLAIFLGTITGFSFVKIAGEAMDRNVLETCPPTKINSYNNSFFGERLFCK